MLCSAPSEVMIGYNAGCIGADRLVNPFSYSLISFLFFAQVIDFSIVNTSLTSRCIEIQSLNNLYEYVALSHTMQCCVYINVLHLARYRQCRGTRVRTLQMIFCGWCKSCGCSDINNFNLNVELGQPNTSAI